MINTSELSLWSAKKIIQLAHENKASHVGGALSIVDALAVLYGSVLNFDISNPDWEERDRLFYSKGHACTALYAILCKAGFYSETDLDSFTKNGSYFTSHVNHKIPGVELSTGSLGHALSVACGVALAGLRKQKDWKVYCILSDGELNEGSNWEAILFAPHHGLSNLTVIVDYNKIQSFGAVKEVLNIEPLSEKFKAFGWHVLEADGHDHNMLLQAFRLNTVQPKVIIANTIKGKGVSFMEHQLSWHYKSPSIEQMNEAFKELENR
jgi:transketolase